MLQLVQRFKVLLLVFKALHGIAPKYIAELLIPQNTKPNYPLSSKTRLKSKAFSVIAPLPKHIKSSPSVDAFKCSLEMYLFSTAFSSVSVWMCVYCF